MCCQLRNDGRSVAACFCLVSLVCNVSVVVIRLMIVVLIILLNKKTCTIVSFLKSHLLRSIIILFLLGSGSLILHKQKLCEIHSLNRTYLFETLSDPIILFHSSLFAPFAPFVICSKLSFVLYQWEDNCILSLLQESSSFSFLESI